jgi:hypothetical protein
MADHWEILADEAGQPLLSGLLTVHAALLPSKKVLFFCGSGHDEKHDPKDRKTGLWDPANPTRVRQLDDPAGVDLFCAGHCMLANGDVFVAGGTANYDREPDNPHRPYHFTGIPDCFVFDWRTERWRTVPHKKWPAWYPSCATLADGRVLAMSGHGGPDHPGHEVLETEIFDPATERWEPARPTAPPLEDTGKFWLFGTRLPMVYYPRLHPLRDGQVFSATALQQIGGARRTRSLDPVTNALTTLGKAPPGMRVWWMPHVYSRSHFTSALLPLNPPDYPERVLIANARYARVFQPAEPGRGWRSAGGKRPYPMRAYGTGLLLPDGSVLVIGGGRSEKVPRWYWPWSEVGGYDRDANPIPERYLPATSTWVNGSAPHYPPIPRMYHSVALLLANGQVLVAGSNHDSQRNHGGVRPDHPHHDDARELRMELYSPPYLFDGTDDDGTPRPAVRPVISCPTDEATYGQLLVLTSPDAMSIRRVTMVRCASVTHAYSTDQRLIELVIDPGSREETELTVTMPPDAGIGIPGYYLLFALGPADTPSLAHMLRLG